METVSLKFYGPAVDEILRLRKLLEQAKAALAEFADSKKYDWDAYGIRFILGDKYEENYVKPWDYADRILKALEKP